MASQFLLILISLIFSSYVFAQSSLREQMLKDRERILKLLDSQDLMQMHKEMRELMDQFHTEDLSIDQFFQDDHFDRFMDRFGPMMNLDEGGHKWLETPTHRILILQQELDSKSPLDINIEDGKIKIKGEIVKDTLNEQGSSSVRSVIRRSFSQTLPLPDDVDGNKAMVEHKDGRLQIKFPKKSSAGLKSGNKVDHDKNKPRSRPNLRPLKPKKGDITI